ncbi:MAG: HAMP domain-containing histidine kinase [Parasporobacterium sp.]|nr:HAMP domain-containing histidine kinase [Parasporobacterium sp.]
MIKKLRLKFIIINMTIVTVMLATIFGFLYFSTLTSMEKQSLQMMEYVTIGPKKFKVQGGDHPENNRKDDENREDNRENNHEDNHENNHGENREDKNVNSDLPAYNFPIGDIDNPSDPFTEDVRLPYFFIRTDAEGNIAETGGGFFDLSDTDYIADILQAAADTGLQSGVLSGYNFRFLHTDTGNGQLYVFTDMSAEQATLQSLLRTFGIIGGAAFLVFLGISILLSRWAVKPVEKAWNQQKQFVADASHELKTPLTVITTDAELLNAPDCPESDRSKLSSDIISMATQMRGLVEKMLDLARIESTSAKTVFTRFSVSDTVTAQAMQFEPLFFENNHPFTYEISPDIYMNGSEGHIKQLTDILLDNAGKYASDGGEIILTLKSISPAKCALEVKNIGEPIKPEHLENLFKRFYRANESRTLNKSYGLGLSIAQQITEEHKGKITAESRDGYNIFRAELPVEKMHTKSAIK